MDSNQPQPSPVVDPASAFAELRAEVSLLRRAIEGLTAERQNAPDYTPTLKAMSATLMRIEEFMGGIAESPAMRLTPENLAAGIANAGETVRADDSRTIQNAQDALSASIASINGVVEQAWTAHRQWKHLYWTAGGGIVFGATGVLSAWYWIG